MLYPTIWESLCQCSWLHKHMLMMSNPLALWCVFHVFCLRLHCAESQPPPTDKPAGLPPWAEECGYILSDFPCAYFNSPHCKTLHTYCLERKTHRSRLWDKCLMATPTSGSCLLHFSSSVTENVTNSMSVNKLPFISLLCPLRLYLFD